MLGKFILTAALLLGTTALAQQSQTPGSQPSSQPNSQNQNQTQCWDMATNQVRTQGTVGSGSGNQPSSGSQNQNSSSQNQQSQGNAANRPAGTANC